jgi:hypothetical protein
MGDKDLHGGAALLAGELLDCRGKAADRAPGPGLGSASKPMIATLPG